MIKKIKVGYNWLYKFAQAMRDGKVCVQVDEELWLFQRNYAEPKQIISEYPYGQGHREDAVADSIRSAFDALLEAARESDIEVREESGSWQRARWLILDTTLESALVQALIKTLTHLNRVSIETEGR